LENATYKETLLFEFKNSISATVAKLLSCISILSNKNQIIND